MLKWASGVGIKNVLFYFDSYTNCFLLALCELLENSESKKEKLTQFLHKKDAFRMRGHGLPL